MNMSQFSNPQKEALLDLIVMAMYTDGHLALKESALLSRFCSALGWNDQYDQDKQLDASITRVRPNLGSNDKIAAHTSKLAQQFPNTEDRGRVEEMLTELVTSDDKITSEEQNFLQMMHAIFSKHS